jgi:hypothetical protein
MKRAATFSDVAPRSKSLVPKYIPSTSMHSSYVYSLHKELLHYLNVSKKIYRAKVLVVAIGIGEAPDTILFTRSEQNTYHHRIPSKNVNILFDHAVIISCLKAQFHA